MFKKKTEKGIVLCCPQNFWLAILYYTSCVYTQEYFSLFYSLFIIMVKNILNCIHGRVLEKILWKSLSFILWVGKSLSFILWVGYQALYDAHLLSPVSCVYTGIFGIWVALLDLATML